MTRFVLSLTVLGVFAACSAVRIAWADEPPGASNPGTVSPASLPAAATSAAGNEEKSAATPAARGPRIEGGQANGHWREGTRLIDQTGQFKIAGDRLSFTSSDGSLRFDCLENLCGQRVARTVTDSPESLVWTVTGELTEFRGTNFLLLSQAILKPRSPRQAQ